jgi:hypothetical protein
VPAPRPRASGHTPQPHGGPPRGGERQLHRARLGPAATARRGPSPLATAASGAGAQPSPPPGCRRPRRSSRVYSQHAAGRRAAAPTPGCRAPPTPAPGCPHGPRGGRLGLRPACMAPGTPPPPGRHERRPRPLPAAPPRPPGATLRAQPRPFTHVRAACNHARPHEALDRHPPAACEASSPRMRPNKRPPLEDPDRVAGRAVRAHGGSRWHHPWGNGSPTGGGDDGGREASAAGIWHVSCGPLTRGRLLARHMRLEEVYGRLTRPR